MKRLTISIQIHGHHNVHPTSPTKTVHLTFHICGHLFPSNPWHHISPTQQKALMDQIQTFKEKGRTQCRRLPAPCGVWGRVVFKPQALPTQMCRGWGSNPGPSSYRRQALPLHQARPSQTFKENHAKNNDLILTISHTTRHFLHLTSLVFQHFSLSLQDCCMGQGKLCQYLSSVIIVTQNGCQRRN